MNVEEVEDDDPIGNVVKRRKIRSELRELIEEAHINKVELTNLKSDRFDDLRNSNNTVSQSITHTRELQLDAIMLTELAKAVHTQGTKIDDMSLKYDIHNFSISLQSKYSNDAGFSWTNLGRDVGVLFRSVPTFQTMLGPIFKEAKVRKAMGRRTAVKEAPAEQTKATEMKHEDDDDDEATNERLQNLYNVLIDLTKQIETNNMSQFQSQSQTQGAPAQAQAPEEPPECGIKFLNVLVDLEDNVQTVENLFDFSFLIKDKKLMLTQDPVSQLPQGLVINGENDEAPMQTVLTVNMKDLNELRQTMKCLHDYESEHDGDGLSQPQSQTQSSSSSSSSNGFKKIKYPSIHRDDELYSQTTWQQADSLLVKKQEKTNNKSQSQKQSQTKSSTSTSSNPKSSQSLSQSQSQSQSSTNEKKSSGGTKRARGN